VTEIITELVARAAQTDASYSGKGEQGVAAADAAPVPPRGLKRSSAATAPPADPIEGEKAKNKRPERPPPAPWARALLADDACTYLSGISRATLRRITRAGKLTPRTVGSRTVYLREDLDRYLEGR
jgi:hypothetical protein